MAEMKKIVGSIIALILLMPAALPAQTTKLPEKVQMFKPKVLDRDIVPESVVEKVQQEPYGQGDRIGNDGSYWIAFSDREENDTYKSPGGKKYKTLNLGQRVLIADIKNEWALVFDQVKNDCPNISPGATSYGWIPLSNLLLWEKCLSDNIGISRKAVICVDLDKTGREKKDLKRMLYNSPEARSGLPLPTNMHFYYVLKRQGERVLLGNNAEIRESADIYGWVDETSFVPWNSRTCLEPNWDVQDVQFFSDKYAEWKVYKTRDYPDKPLIRDRFRKDRGVRSQDWVEERYRTFPPTYLRFPILEGGDDMYYKCTSFGSLNSSESFSTTASSYDKARRSAEELLNLVIVIDGTSSMRNYFAAVKKALAEVDKYLPDDKVNVGVLIYRDKEDGDYVTECFPSNGGFTKASNQNLRNWLETAGEYGTKSVAKEEEESVYYGINMALDRFFPADKDMKNQSNIMLIIGDCGDNGKYKISSSTLVDKLAAQNVSIMGFQVTNKNRDAYKRFTDDIKFLIRASVQKRYENMTSQEVKIYLKEVENGYDLKNEDEDGRNFFIGKLRYNPKVNEAMKVEDLTSGIGEVVGEWKRSVQVLTSMGGNFIQTGKPVTMARDDTVGALLDEDAVISIIGEENYKVLKDQNALISFRGYAPKRYANRPLFKVVVFFPEAELKNLVRSLDKVSQAAMNGNADRRPYYEAMMSLARSTVAQGQIRTSSYYEILAKVFGIADYKPRGYTLDDIVEPGVVSSDEYKKIVNEMEQSIRRLKSVLQKNYPFVMETPGTKDKYYWLPSDYLPLPL